MNSFNKIRTVFFMAVIMLIVAAGCDQQEVVETPTVAPSPVPTETQVVEDTPEASVACVLPLPASDDWEVALCETFDDNSHGWQEETQDNPYAAYTSAVTGGKFVVDYRAKSFAGFTRSALTWFDVIEERNFAMSVTGQIDSSFTDLSWGVAFRGDETSYFLFSLVNDTYVFEVFEDNRWLPLITPKQTSVIRVGEPNTVRIEASGGDFFFSINGEMVNQFSGAALPGAAIQLMVSANEGANGVFIFDDVVVQR
jgi:hypothetical protein